MLTFLFTKTPLVFFAQSLWRDEAFSYLMAKNNIISIITLTAHDFNPPFYYLVLHCWIKIFGRSEIALRSLSLIFFWATIYVAYLFLRDILKFSVKKAFFYLLFFIINPLFTYYAFEARMYTMLAFFASLSFYAFYQKNKRLYLIATVLGLYTHYFMFFVILTQLVYSFLTKNKKVGRKVMLYPLFIFLPWLIFMLISGSYFTESFWIKNINIGTVINYLGEIYTDYNSELKFYNQSITKLSVTLLILILFSLFQSRHQPSKVKRLFYYLLSWVLIPFIMAFAISIFKPIILPRYLIFCSIGLLILLIYIIERTQIFFRIIIIMALFFITVNYQQLAIKYRQKSDLRKKIHEIKKLAKNKDLLYVVDELDFHIAQYYFDEERVFIYGKTYQEIPNFVGKILIPQEKVIHSLPQYPQKAFILKSDGSYDIQAMN